MNLQDYYRSLDADEREAFALRAKTSRAYIEIHLMAPDMGRRKTPRQALMKALAEASDGNCSMTDVLAHFFEVAA